MEYYFYPTGTWQGWTSHMRIDPAYGPDSDAVTSCISHRVGLGLIAPAAGRMIKAKFRS